MKTRAWHRNNDHEAASLYGLVVVQDEAPLSKADGRSAPWLDESRRICSHLDGATPRRPWSGAGGKPSRDVFVCAFRFSEMKPFPGERSHASRRSD